MENKGMMMIMMMMMMMKTTLLFITGIQTTHQWFSKRVPWNFGCYVIADKKIINNFV